MKETGAVEIYIDEPREIKAVWTKEYTQLIIILIAIFAVILAIVMLIKRRG